MPCGRHRQRRRVLQRLCGVAAGIDFGNSAGLLLSGPGQCATASKARNNFADGARTHFVHFLQNHDQVANSARSVRTHLLTSPGRHRALTALVLLGPQTPLLFMGQEFSASSPFYYFADHEPDLAALVRKGRREFMSQFPSMADFESMRELPDPAAPDTFDASKLDWRECEQNKAAVNLHRDLIRLRKQDPIFSRQDNSMIEGTVIGPEALLLRWFDSSGDDRLMFINLGRDLEHSPPAEPLLAPPPGRRWQLLWSSEDSHYGGRGTPKIDEAHCRVAGHSALVLHVHAE